MKSPLLTGFGVAVGVAVYEVLTHGLSGADWYRAIFVGVFCGLVFALYELVRPRPQR
ncbi:hypothetical protein [Idiomarina sp. HP20-50]|uniref:hypothetical protein n=1 Tax=Idiomarina sp. HP20-50 TaxID=3070813 RepID=UPI00294B7BF2|nr:hypothetical protein [Idiomarina sp. HP20-50]MDV6317189.1 hypothetical protein [Idiomarina sp. HP20-50]